MVIRFIKSNPEDSNVYRKPFLVIDTTPTGVEQAVQPVVSDSKFEVWKSEQ